MTIKLLLFNILRLLAFFLCNQKNKQHIEVSMRKTQKQQTTTKAARKRLDTLKSRKEL